MPPEKQAVRSVSQERACELSANYFQSFFFSPPFFTDKGLYSSSTPDSISPRFALNRGRASLYFGAQPLLLLIFTSGKAALGLRACDTVS